MVMGRPRLLTSMQLYRMRGMHRSGTPVSRLKIVFDVSAETVRRRLRKPYKQPERASL